MTDARTEGQKAGEASGRPNVVIVGAGFGGLSAAKLLSRRPLHTTVVDRNNHHLFQPLLYQVATAGLSPADIAMPIRWVLRRARNNEVLMAVVEKIDVEQRLLHLDRNELISYDYLVLATGARHGYFGHPEWEPLAPGLKTVEDATEIRRRILIAFEEAERTQEPALREALLTFVIVGGGATGIELAGAIAELARYALVKDFDHINPSLAKIVLVEAGDRILSSFPADLSLKAQRALEKLGVKVLLKRRVTNISKEGVQVDGEFIPARTAIWAAGVVPSRLGKDLGAPLDRTGRVLVNDDLSLPGHPEVFVIGDLAAVKAKNGQLVPGVAPAAMQMGRHAARNILRKVEGEKTLPFVYVDKGSLATIGRARAVADLAVVHLSGYIAWLAWLFIHILYLIGFRNRVLVLFQWAWSYATFQRGTRLITGANPWASSIER
jgi:NADH dehydrogenase